MRFPIRKAVLGMAAMASLLAISHAMTSAADLAQSDRLSIPRAIPQASPQNIPEDDTLGLDCVAEATAFTEVADLAYVFKEDGGVLAGALFDLREQLLDCLATSSEERDGQSFTPSRQEMRSI
ncbi:hypothetical protein N7E02_01760 (plasmid) [Aliirhizobium terrae]|uniref:hypothetical protein n=1 Tax=Terrirhizobium terrae TaxID=2926709 RepID=UPI0025782E5F|nr:hypothetical protein [Rhizobium sp. CC-CFT758]WJH38133.1 hypothetical protein N7E02_01760 [Rhizobium sp. CC-CFT758]